jgi:predicted PurR-regulated permease PerM
MAMGADADGSGSRRVMLAPVTFVYVVGALLVGMGLFALLRAASSMLTTIGVGVVLALALDPVVSAIRRRWHWGRTEAALLIMGGVLGLTVVLVVVMGPRAVAQARMLSSDIPGTVREFYTLPLVGGWLEQNDAAAKVDDAVKRLPSQLSDEQVTDTVTSLVGGALRALLVLAVATATLLDGEHLVGRARRLVPPAWAERADGIGRVFYVAIAQYFSGSLTVAVLMGVVVLTLCLAFGVPLAPLAALWAMLTDLVPQVGGFLGGALLGVLALTQGPVVFVVVVGLYVLYMNLENHVISPAIVGPAVDVTPPTTMLAALVGGAVAGVPGALVATPFCGAVKQLYLKLRWGRQPFASDSSGPRHDIRKLRGRRRPLPDTTPSAPA